METGAENATACFIVCSLFVNNVISRMLCFVKKVLERITPYTFINTLPEKYFPKILSSNSVTVEKDINLCGVQIAGSIKWRLCCKPLNCTRLWEVQWPHGLCARLRSRAVWVRVLGHCVVFLGKTLHPGVSFIHPSGESIFNARGQPCDGVASHSGGSRIIPTHLMLQKLG